MAELLPPIPGPTYSITVEVRGRYHCPTCDETLPGSSMDHVDDGQYAFGHVHITTSYQALRHVRACTGKDQPMPSQKTTITMDQVDTELATAHQMIDELDAMQKRLPVCPARHAASTARQVVQALGQALWDMKRGTAHVTVVDA